MSKLDIAKQGIGVVVGAGVGSIVRGIVDATVPQETPVQRVLVLVGKVSISSFVTHHVKLHVNDAIDEVVEWYKTNTSDEEAK